MSSLSNSLATEKDRSETNAHLMTPSNSVSLSTTSNRSIIIDDKNNLNGSQQNLSIQKSSSKKTFTLNSTRPKQSLSKIVCLFFMENKYDHVCMKIGKSRKQPSSLSLQLIDAYRFRDTLKLNDTRFSSRPKIR